MGGTNGYFPEGQCNKPWSNDSGNAVNEFYDNKDKWYSTWNPGTTDSALKIDYVRVFENDKAPRDVQYVQN